MVHYDLESEGRAQWRLASRSPWAVIGAGGGGWLPAPELSASGHGQSRGAEQHRTSPWVRRALGEAGQGAAGRAGPRRPPLAPAGAPGPAAGLRPAWTGARLPRSPPAAGSLWPVPRRRDVCCKARTLAEANRERKRERNLPRRVPPPARGRRGKEGVTTVKDQWEAWRSVGASHRHVLGLVARREPPEEVWTALLLCFSIAESAAK